MKTTFKKTLMVLIVSLISLPLLTSCNKEDEIEMYYMDEGEMSVNYQNNSFIRALVSVQIEYDASTGNNLYIGTKNDAINWFNSKCDIIAAPNFTSGIPVLDNSVCTFELKQSISSPDGDFPVISTRTIAFTPSSTQP